MTDTTRPEGPLRLGIIGTGLAVEKLHWPALKRIPDRYTVTAFSNHTRPKAEHFASYSNTPMDRFVERWEDLLQRDDVDAVLISLPIDLNYPVSKAAAEAGKHVICEKPPGADLDEGRAYVEMVEAHPDLTILVAENAFYRDNVRFARSLLDDDAIGRVHLASWRQVSQLIPREGQFSSTPWRHDPAYRGGAHLDGGVHHTAQIRMLCGDAERLSGEIQDANSTHGGPSDLTLNLRFVSGAIGNYTASYPEISVPSESNGMRLYGTGGVMVINGTTITVHTADGVVDTYRIEQPDGGYLNEFLNFHEAISGEAPLVGTAAQSYRNMEMVLAGLSSAEAGTVTTLEAWPTPLSASAVPLWRPAGSSDLLDARWASVSKEHTTTS
ncbi:MAG TPA: Gfo/Idh/MocA family oxidoreductase [Thermomicrobiales bacterium]|nr:Gfo/Idh/MocA family oxidoreductase [Thermomicrobiales bacterium]